jgi:DUF971 family protein
MSAIPTSLGLKDGTILVMEWSDGQRRTYTAKELRDRCPCASCRDKRSQPSSLLPVLTPQETRPLTIVDMQPVGNYAYGIMFSDGHSTGIFTLESLREMGRQG